MMPDPPYRPIDCDFHDVLEATATRKRVASVVFVDEGGRMQAGDARIVDLATRPEGEYMRLDTGEEVRFDRIVSVDGIPSPGQVDD